MIFIKYASPIIYSMVFIASLAFIVWTGIDMERQMRRCEERGGRFVAREHMCIAKDALR